MKVWRNTLLIALTDTIALREKYEKGKGYTSDSIYLTQLRDIERNLEDRNTTLIEIRDEQ